MTFLKYLVLTPFTPIQMFRSFEEGSNKANLGIYSFLIGIVILLCITTATALLEFGFEYISLTQITSFASGLILKQAFLAYLIWVCANRFRWRKVRFDQSLAIVSFALLPLSVGYIWSVLDFNTAYLGYGIGGLWGYLLNTTGITAIVKIKPIMAIIFTASLYIIMFVASAIIFGIKL